MTHIDMYKYNTCIVPFLALYVCVFVCRGGERSGDRREQQMGCRLLPPSTLPLRPSSLPPSLPPPLPPSPLPCPSTQGDAFLISFHEPFDAVSWCLSTQLALNNLDWPMELLRHPR